MAMVMGPRPPGHRGDPAGATAAALEIDVTDKLSRWRAVDPHVKHCCPGTDPVPGDEARLADRGHQQFRAFHFALADRAFRCDTP